MKVLLDANVLLDVGMRRAPHLDASARVMAACHRLGSSGVAWHSLAVVAFYMKREAPAFVEDLMRWTAVVTVGERDARYALSLGMADFEDALQVAAAVAHGAEAIVTRDRRDFRKSPVPAISPAEFSKRVGA